MKKERIQEGFWGLGVCSILYVILGLITYWLRDLIGVLWFFFTWPIRDIIYELMGWDRNPFSIVTADYDYCVWIGIMVIGGIFALLVIISFFVGEVKKPDDKPAQ